LADLANYLNDNGTEAYYKKCDITIKADVENAIEFAVSKTGTIDIAVLNAGVAGSGYFENFDSENFNRIIQTNVFGMTNFLEELIPIMKGQGYGKIAGVSSLADSRGIPGNAAYCASKSAVSFLLEAARVELKSTGIKIITIRPGFVKSDMTSKNTFYMPLLMEPGKAAKIIVEGVLKGKERIAFPLPLVLISYIGRVVPAFLFEIIIRLRGKPINE
jgi:NAD(P)-dependent dehydrogenase (short-subunit alcohol dehydrogenase family)